MHGYTITDLLIGTHYKGRRGHGTIAEARKRDDVWVRYDGNAYAVRVVTDNAQDFWATIFIEEEN